MGVRGGGRLLAPLKRWTGSAVSCILVWILISLKKVRQPSGRVIQKCQPRIGRPASNIIASLDGPLDQPPNMIQAPCAQTPNHEKPQPPSPAAGPLARPAGPGALGSRITTNIIGRGDACIEARESRLPRRPDELVLRAGRPWALVPNFQRGDSCDH